jgi:hypothetical protein
VYKEDESETKYYNIEGKEFEVRFEKVNIGGVETQIRKYRVSGESGDFRTFEDLAEEKIGMWHATTYEKARHSGTERGEDDFILIPLVEYYVVKKIKNATTGEIRGNRIRVDIKRADIVELGYEPNLEPERTPPGQRKEETVEDYLARVKKLTLIQKTDDESDHEYLERTQEELNRCGDDLNRLKALVRRYPAETNDSYLARVNGLRAPLPAEENEDYDERIRKFNEKKDRFKREQEIFERIMRSGIDVETASQEEIAEQINIMRARERKKKVEIATKGEKRKEAKDRERRKNIEEAAPGGLIHTNKIERDIDGLPIRDEDDNLQYKDGNLEFVENGGGMIEINPVDNADERLDNAVKANNLKVQREAAERNEATREGIGAFREEKKRKMEGKNADEKAAFEKQMIQMERGGVSFGGRMGGNKYENERVPNNEDVAVDSSSRMLFTEASVDMGVGPDIFCNVKGTFERLHGEKVAKEKREIDALIDEFVEPANESDVKENIIKKHKRNMALRGEEESIEEKIMKEGEAFKVAEEERLRGERIAKIKREQDENNDEGLAVGGFYTRFRPRTKEEEDRISSEGNDPYDQLPPGYTGIGVPVVVDVDNEKTRIRIDGEVIGKRQALLDAVRNGSTLDVVTALEMELKQAEVAQEKRREEALEAELAREEERGREIEKRMGGRKIDSDLPDDVRRAIRFNAVRKGRSVKEEREKRKIGTMIDNAELERRRADFKSRKENIIREGKRAYAAMVKSRDERRATKKEEMSVEEEDFSKNNPLMNLKVLRDDEKEGGVDALDDEIRRKKQHTEDIARVSKEIFNSEGFILTREEAIARKVLSPDVIDILAISLNPNDGRPVDLAGANAIVERAVLNGHPDAVIVLEIMEEEARRKRLRMVGMMGPGRTPNLR